MEEPRVEAVFEHPDRVRDVTFSGDSGYLITACEDGTVHVWDTRWGKHHAVLSGHGAAVTHVAISNTDVIASASDDMTVRLWSARTGQALSVLPGHKALVTSVAFSANGELVAAATADHTARVWGTSSGSALFVLEGHSGRVNTVSFSKDTQRLVTSSDDQTAVVWNVRDGTRRARLAGHTDRVVLATFSPSGDAVLTLANDRTIRTWDPRTGQERRRLDAPYPVFDTPVMSYSPDGSMIAVGRYFDGTATLFDVTSGKLLHRLEGHREPVYALPVCRTRIPASPSRTRTGTLHFASRSQISTPECPRMIGGS